MAEQQATVQTGQQLKVQVQIQIEDLNDTTVYMVTDSNSVVRSAPPALASSGSKLPMHEQVHKIQRCVKGGAAYVKVRKVYGGKQELGWTAEGNLVESDVPTEARYGCVAVSGYFTKNGRWLQQAAIDALGGIPNPIEIKDAQGNVTGTYYWRLTECMLPTGSHQSKGHYTGHCVDIGFCDSTGATVVDYDTAGGEPRAELEAKGKAAFASSVLHDNHFHGQTDYPSWMADKTTDTLKRLLNDRKSEY